MKKKEKKERNRKLHDFFFILFYLYLSEFIWNVHELYIFKHFFFYFVFCYLLSTISILLDLHTMQQPINFKVPYHLCLSGALFKSLYFSSWLD